MKIAKEKEYVLLDDRSSNFLAAIVICLLGALIGGTAYVNHGYIVEPKWVIWSKGPCFFLPPAKSTQFRSKEDFDDPENYSGYSVIVDTLWDRMSKIQQDKEKKPQTMMVNGKEYILQ